MCWAESVVRELGTAFIVVSGMQSRVIIKGLFFNLSIIDVHRPHFRSIDDIKDALYAQLERDYDSCPSHDVKIIIAGGGVQTD